MAVHELILLLCEIARDKWCSYWEHDPQWCACGAVQAISLACYVIYDVYGSGTSPTFGHSR